MPIDKKQSEKDEDSNVKELDEVFVEPPLVTVTDTTTTNVLTPTTSKVTIKTTEPSRVISSIGRIHSRSRPSVALSSSMMEDIKEENMAEKKLELLEELDQIDKTIEKAKLESKTESDRDNIIRKCRSDRRSIENQIKDLSVKIDTLSFQKYIKEKKKKIDDKETENIEKHYGVTEEEMEKLTLKEENKSKYHREVAICDQYREDIIALYQDIDKIMEDDSTLTEVGEEERQIEIDSKVNTLKVMVDEYKNHNKELTQVGGIDGLSTHLKGLQYILSLSNSVNAKKNLLIEKAKKRLALTKSEALEGLKLQPFDGMGDKRYLDYYVFYNEFCELIMNREYSEVAKLRYLKQYLRGDALQLIKNYHQGKELLTAFKVLDGTYGRPDMVIRECLRTIRNLEQLRSEKDIKANKNFLSKLKTNISTLQCYNFNIDGDDNENSAFLISIEEKLSHDTYVKWEEEKTEMRKRRDAITVDSLLEFFSERIRREEQVSYVRQNRADEEKKNVYKQKTKLYTTKMKAGRPPVKPGGNNAFNKNQNHFKPHNNNANANRYKNAFCIFCESNGHGTGFCGCKYTKDFKEEKCKKHNACFSCLRTTEHKSDSCPQQKEMPHLQQVPSLQPALQRRD